MEYNLDELNPPEWMDKQFFNTVLRSSEGDASITVSDLEIFPATKKGDHFASIMFRAKVIYTSKTKINQQISLIVKSEPQEEGIKKEMLGNTPIYDIEMQMYTKTIPEMQRLLKIAGDEIIIVPKIIYCSKSPCRVIVLEDLSLQNFVMTEKFLNFNGSKIVFERLAKWHACSYYMDNDKSVNNNAEIKSYNVNFFNGTMGDSTKNFLLTNIEGFTKILKTWDGFERFEENFDAFKKNFLINGIKAYTPNTELSGGYNVLNHGDFHFKNMMFKKKNDEIDDVIFIDFQICMYGSPAIDLSYALNIIGDSDCRTERRLELIYHYYQTFVTTLKNIGFLGTVPTMLDLQMELLKCGFIEVMITICFVPFVHIDFNKYNMEELMGTVESDSKEIVLQNPEVQQILKQKVPEWVLKGLMD